MDGRLRDDTVVVGGDARQRFYDARAYGRPLDGGRVGLSLVEAAHLLYRGDLDAVVDDGERYDFPDFLAAAARGIGPAFLVYADLRDRGFYLSPDREGWVDDPGDAAFVVYPRGKKPWDDEVLYRVDVVGERASLPPDRLDGRTVAVVDEESEISYYETAPTAPSGGTTYSMPDRVTGTLLDERVVVWDPPAGLHEKGFYGQPLSGRDGGDAVQLSLVEAAYLAAEGVLEVDADGSLDAVVSLGRAVEGDRFDRRLRVYRELRDRGMVPKTGFKFGADFRVYETVETVSDLPHAEYLVRVVPGDAAVNPRDLALDVRLAHGVRKQMLFARHAENADTTDWLAVSRLTP